MDSKIKVVGGNVGNHVRFYDDNRKTTEYPIVNGEIQFTNNTIPDVFFVEGVKLNDAKAAIRLDLEITVGGQHIVVDKIKFSVGPVLESLEVETAEVAFVNQPNTFHLSAGYLLANQQKKRGAKIIAKVVEGSTNHPGVKFVQTLDAKTVEIYYSDLYTIDANGNVVPPQPKLRVQEQIKNGINGAFPFLDANSPANSAQTIFYDLNFTEIPKGTFSATDSPKTAVFNKVVGNEKFDHAKYKSFFTTTVVFAYSDGTIYPIASTKWDFDAILNTQFTDNNNNNVEDQGERAPILGNPLGPVGLGQFEIAPVNWNQMDNSEGDTPPSKLVPPVANDALHNVIIP